MRILRRRGSHLLHSRNEHASVAYIASPLHPSSSPTYPSPVAPSFPSSSIVDNKAEKDSALTRKSGAPNSAATKGLAGSPCGGEDGRLGGGEGDDDVEDEADAIENDLRCLRGEFWRDVPVDELVLMLRPLCISRRAPGSLSVLACRSLSFSFSLPLPLPAIPHPNHGRLRSLCCPSFFRRSHSPRYRSYPSRKTALTRELKMSSPRGFCAGGMGARGTPLETSGGAGLGPGERVTGDPGGERFPREERTEEDE